jgi:hypothetical protein
LASVCRTQIRRAIHMQLVCLADRSQDRRRPPDPVKDDPLHYVPELPSAVGRWTVRLKAEVVRAVRGGWIPIDEVCQRYGISADEFVAWERDLDRYGIPGLRTTRYQIYRNTDKQKG